MGLHNYLIDSTANYSDRPAVVEPDIGSITYTDLNTLTERVRDRLVHFGVKQGDRVGIMLHKTIDAVACVYGTLKSGAAYVPVDVSGPVARAAYIFTDCSVKVVFAEKSVAQSLSDEIDNLNLCFKT